MSTMGLNQLILFNAAWWVFATAAAFGAAILFWNKGAAHLSGSPLPGTNLVMKMSGAGAIWATTLLLFFLFQPLKTWNEIVLITTSAQEAPQGLVNTKLDNDPDIVKALKQSGDGDLLQVELFYKDTSYVLEQETGNTFAYHHPIPAGFYELRVTNITKQTKPVMRMIELPAASAAAPMLAARLAAAPAVPSPTTPAGTSIPAPAATQAGAR